MRRFIWATSYLAGGAAAGCLSAFVLIQSAGVETVEAGTPWLSRAAALRDSGAFYARAHYLLDGRLPPAPGQLTEATAETDSDGRPLTGVCSYRLLSSGPLPRWWSLTVIGADGASAPLQSTAGSDMAIRRADGGVEIVVSPAPSSGNWLKSPPRRRLTLLYSALPQPALSGPPPFTLRQEDCR